MSDRNGALDDALDQAPAGGGTVRVARPGSTAEVDVVDVDRLGVRIRALRVVRERPVDVVGEARALPDRLRALPDRLEPVEVAPELGGARLRTRPDELRGREYFEADVEPSRTTIRRTRIGDDGVRGPTDWAVTRDDLDRLIDETTG
ncbi:MAG: hypothetical protein ABMB14_09950 [Myxococcota bacterium]